MRPRVVGVLELDIEAFFDTLEHQHLRAFVRQRVYHGVIGKQVEIWFGIFQRKTLRNASFRSTEQLIAAIHDFTAAYNQNAAPFVWRKREVRGAQLRNTIVNLTYAIKH